MLSRVTQCLVNPENKQQLPQPHLYQLFLWSPTSNRSSWGLCHEAASGCMPLRVSMVELRLCSDTIFLGTGRVHPHCHHFVRSLFFQFVGSLPWLDTRLRVPVSLFALVASFGLSFVYTSQTRSTRWVYPVLKTHVGWIRPFHIRRRFSIPRFEKYAQHHPGLLLPHAGYSRDSWISLSLEESN